MLKQKDQEFKLSLSCLVRPYLKQKGSRIVTNWASHPPTKMMAHGECVTWFHL